MPDYLSIRDVCAKYGLADATVRRKVRNGELTAQRCGPRLLKFDPEQVHAELMRPVKTGPTDDVVARIVAGLPPLNDVQVQRIVALLTAGGGAG